MQRVRERSLMNFGKKHIQSKVAHVNRIEQILWELHSCSYSHQQAHRHQRPAKMYEMRWDLDEQWEKDRWCHSSSKGPGHSSKQRLDTNHTENSSKNSWDEARQHGPDRGGSQTWGYVFIWTFNLFLLNSLFPIYILTGSAVCVLWIVAAVLFAEVSIAGSNPTSPILSSNEADDW